MQLSTNTPVFELILDETKYTLAFPLKAVAAAEEKLGHSLRTLGAWLKLETKEFPIVLEAGLSKFHPVQTAEHAAKIVESLSAEILDQLHYELCKLAFPKALAKLESVQAENALPNEQSGTTQGN